MQDMYILKKISLVKIVSVFSRKHKIHKYTEPQIWDQKSKKDMRYQLSMRIFAIESLGQKKDFKHIILNMELI